MFLFDCRKALFFVIMYLHATLGGNCVLMKYSLGGFDNQEEKVPLSADVR